MLSVSNTVYDTLVQLKGKRESFSEVITELLNDKAKLGEEIKKRQDLRRFKGIIGNAAAKEWLSQIENDRRNFGRNIKQF
ncbi:MAG: antitoxin VapB family protein [Candidatus Micrarchaeaceae archaeon]